MSLNTISTLIKQKAISLGFSACGITQARKLEEEEPRVKDYLGKNFNGEMGYMANHFDQRLDPTLLVEGAKSVVVVLMNYFPHHLQQGEGIPIVSKFAYGIDYHLVVKERLQRLFNFIDLGISPIKGRVFTDSAPLLERVLAVQAGLGWIGKNGLLINRKLGSFFFIGELVIDLTLEYDRPLPKGYCGSCSRCQDACPTNAIVSPYCLDARSCLSYLTIERKGDIPEKFKPMLSNRVFGCDICQDICPWNHCLQPHSIKEFDPQPELLGMSKEEWEQMDEIRFKRIFSHSSVERAGFRKLKNNIENVISSTNGSIT